MRTLAIILFAFFTTLSVLIYFNRNYKYEDYTLETKSTEKKQYRLNLNLATWQDFRTLPGIGEKTAKKITEDRDINGRFEKVEDLTRVDGISLKKFESIKKYLTLDV